MTIGSVMVLSPQLSLPLLDSSLWGLDKEQQQV